MGIFTSTPEGKFLSVNPALAQLFGYESPEELMGQVERAGIAELLYPEARERPGVVKDILRSRGWLTKEMQYRHKSGRIITARVKFRSVPTPEGDVYLEGFVEEIPELPKQADAVSPGV
ncbi:MAG: PAS domain-containing protein [Desulfobaccales bacterium]